MSNRNNKSKSPQIKKPLTIDKDLMKYLILQKITKPQQTIEMTKTQPDEEVEDFKQEIEQKYRYTKSRFKQCKANRIYVFPKEGYETSSDASLDSLIDIQVYPLNGEPTEKLTDATQPQFIRALNDKLSKLEQETPKQHNYVQKSSRVYSQSNKKPVESVGKSIHEGRQGSQGREILRDSFTKPVRGSAGVSSDKKKKQIQQLLKITQQKCTSFYKKTPQINNNYVNISTNFNNSVIIKKNLQDYRVKTEYDDQDQFQHSRPKMRESVKTTKKVEFPQHKVLNYTMDNHLLESLGISRNAKSQNKNYKC